ncbi:STAS domain-containing protein [Streptomyces sp. NPDC002889]|uniref:STAS domain-containing protein n=1 Tax=Streptomyces sp. NPDC002889 TaxID=3364669 RepID=UPI0036D13D78
MVEAEGELDLDSLPPLEQALQDAARTHGVVVLDLAHVTFGDSRFLDVLLRIHRLTELRIVSAPPLLQRMFAITGADQVLSLYTGRDDMPDAT